MDQVQSQIITVVGKEVNQLHLALAFAGAIFNNKNPANKAGGLLVTNSYDFNTRRYILIREGGSPPIILMFCKFSEISHG